MARVQDGQLMMYHTGSVRHSSVVHANLFKFQKRRHEKTLGQRKYRSTYTSIKSPYAVMEKRGDS
jgi:hypothetical protein